MTITSAICGLRAWCAEARLPWPEDAASQFEKYAALLMRCQRQANLTGFSTPEALAEGLFKDSLEILRGGALRGPLIDVGTGAGFPAIPIKLVCPQLEMTLVEPRTKRYAFLRMAERELGLEKISICRCRIEHAEVPDPLGTAISKAFAPIARWLEITRPWAEKGADTACLVSEDDWNGADLKDYRVKSMVRVNRRIYAVLSLL